MNFSDWAKEHMDEKAEMPNLDEQIEMKGKTDVDEEIIKSLLGLKKNEEEIKEEMEKISKRKVHTFLYLDYLLKNAGIEDKEERMRIIEIMWG